MKRTLMVIGLTGAMTLASTMPAMAINKEWSAVLGFVGGVLVSQNCGYRQASYSYGYGGCQQPVVVRQSYCPPPVVVQSCPTPRYRVRQAYYQPTVVVVQPQGHYEIRQQEQCVPGYWKYEQLNCNTYRKVWCPGYTQIVQTKVWVSDVACN